MALLQKAYLGATPLFKEAAWFEDVAFQYGDQVLTAASLTASSTVNTKGAWTELIASTSSDVDYMIVRVFGVNQSGSAGGALLDIGTGASGSETAIAENIAIGSAGGNSPGATSVYFSIPVKIASGTRIAARMQSVISSKSASINILCFNFGQGLLLPSSIDVLGTSTATSRGTQLSANNVWTEIVASTSTDYTGFSLVPSASNNFMAALSGTYELGVGASGSEVSIGSFAFQAQTIEAVSNDNFRNQLFIYGKVVPAGSRLAVRQTENVTYMDACVIAVPKP
jgi:hypothetical protein